MKKLFIVMLSIMLSLTIGLVNVFAEDESEPVESQYFTWEGERYKLTIGIRVGDEAYDEDEIETYLPVMEGDKQVTIYICANKADEDGNNIGPATDEIYELLKNSGVSFIKEDDSCLSVSSAGDFTYLFNYYDPETDDTKTKEIETNSYTIEASAPSFDHQSEELIISFTIAGQEYRFPFTINFDFSQSDEFTVDMADGEYVISGTAYKLNEILADKASLKSFYETYTGRTLTNDTYISFLFKSDTAYSGPLTVNCYDSADDTYDIAFDTLDSNYREYEQQVYENRQFAKESNNAAISGTLQVGSGNINIRHLNFVNDDAYDTGITRTGDFGSFMIDECLVAGYETGLSINRGLITSSLLEDNKTGVIMTPGDDEAGIEFSRSFLAGNETAIVVAGNYGELKLEEDCFYGNDTDYYLAEEVAGVLFTRDNFFAADYETGSKNSNVRSARVVYEGDAAELVTSPCVRYPESGQYYLGIDTAQNIITKFLVDPGSYRESAYALNLQDLKDLPEDFSADLYYKETQKDIARITFPAGIDIQESEFGISFAYDDGEEKILYCYASSDYDMFAEFTPQITMLEISKGEVYFNSKNNRIDSETIEGQLSFTVSQSGDYIITIPSDYAYVGPDKANRSRYYEDQVFIINSGEDLQFIFRDLNRVEDDAFADFTANGSSMYIDRGETNGFMPEKDDPSLYLSEDGCLILTFHERFLNSLTTGSHRLSVKFTDGYADAPFRVEMPVIKAPAWAVRAAGDLPDFLLYKLPMTGN